MGVGNHLNARGLSPTSMVDLGPVTDNHLHVDVLTGLGPVNVAKLFHRSGGSHMLVVNKMVADYGVTFRSVDDFRRASAAFLASVKEINDKTPVRAFAVIGPHPVELVKLWGIVGREKSVSIMREALSFSTEMIRDGKALALGEVGRPHFPVSDEILEASNDLLDLTFRLAADAGCAVQLHTESSTPEQYVELASRARSAGLDPEKVVKHHSPPLVEAGLATGILPSVIARRPNVEEALSEGDRFLMETDYMDDERRPGAVLGPRTVPRVTRSLMERGLLDEGSANRIHVLNVETTYGVEISL